MAFKLPIMQAQVVRSELLNFVATALALCEGIQRCSCSWSHSLRPSNLR